MGVGNFKYKGHEGFSEKVTQRNAYEKTRKGSEGGRHGGPKPFTVTR